MDFLGDILGTGATLLGSIFTGGLTGIFGAGLSLWGEIKKREQDLEAKRIDNAHDIEVMNTEWAHRTRETEIVEGARIQVSENEAFAASYRTEPMRYLDTEDAPTFVKILLGIVDAVRGFIRPFLTIYLVVLTTLIYSTMTDVIGEGPVPLTKDQAGQIILMVINTILYLTTTTVLWWFGTRNKQTPPKAAR